MIEAGILLGLSREISTQLVVQTMLGTAKQLRDERMHPVELREMVTSPGGTTIAAIRELETAGVRAAFLNAIQAAMIRVARARCRRRLARRQQGRIEPRRDPAVAGERLEREHGVGDPRVLEKLHSLLERPQDGRIASSYAVASSLARATRAPATSLGNAAVNCAASAAASASRPSASSASTPA